MSFGWSVTDLVGGIKMIVKISAALSDSMGSSKKFNDVITQLRVLETTLSFVRNHAETCERQGDERAKAAFLPIIDASRDKIDSILEQLDGYQKHLGPASKLYKSRLTDTISKVKFTLFREKDILGWQTSLTMFCTTLTAMLTSYKLFQGELTTANKSVFQATETIEEELNGISTQASKDQSQTIELLHTVNHLLSTAQTTFADILRQISKMGDQNQVLISAQQAHIQEVNDSAHLMEVMLKNIEELRRDLRLSQQNALIGAQIFSQKFKFEDALGSMSDLDLNWVGSAETLHVQLVHRFQLLPGAEMVRKRQYILNDAFTGERMDFGTGRNKFFLSGQVILMSMCFEVQGQVLGVCPRCGSEAKEASNGAIICQDSYCGISLRRIEELEIAEVPTVQARQRSDPGPLEGEFMKFRRLGILPAPIPAPMPAPIPAATSGLTWLLSSGYDAEAEKEVAAGPSTSSNSGTFNFMLEEYDEQLQKEMIERMKMDKALAFWSPLELGTIRSRDATS